MKIARTFPVALVDEFLPESHDLVQVLLDRVLGVVVSLDQLLTVLVDRLDAGGVGRQLCSKVLVLLNLALKVGWILKKNKTS